MCDCIKGFEERLITKLTDNLKKDDAGFLKITSNNFSGRVLLLSGKGKNKPPIALKYEYEYLRTLKNGKEKIKKDSVNILPSYCSFCGQPYDK